MRYVLSLLSTALFLGPSVSNSQDFWEQTNGPYGGNWSVNICVQSLAINSNGVIFAGAFKWISPIECGYIGVYRSADNGDTWLYINFYINFFVDVAVNCFAVNSSGHVFAATGRGNVGGAGGGTGIFRSTDNGGRWTQINNGLNNKHMYALAINARGDLFAGNHAGEVYRSINNGDTWIRLTGYAGRMVKAFACNSNGHVFAGTGGGVYRSTDNGDTWTQIGFADTSVGCLVINAGGHIFAGTGEDVYRSTDNGNTWTKIGLTETGVGCFAINAGGHIFAGTGEGVYRSTDNGETWTLINGGLTTTVVNSLAINSDGFVFAGSEGYGVFRSLESTTAITETRRNQPLSFGLNQNYPNPFNPSTTIEFTLPKPDFVTLKIYNTLGEEVATLVSEKLPAGKHQRVWEAKGLASGVYVYRLETGQFAQTRKLILLR